VTGCPPFDMRDNSFSEIDQGAFEGEVLPTLGRRAFLAAGLGTLFLAACSPEPNTDAPDLPPSIETTSAGDNGDPQLRLLDHYEHEAGVAPRMMQFIGFPESYDDAVHIAGGLAKDLREWRTKGVEPIVIMEPTFNGGQTMMDLESFHKGSYDGPLDTFFATLQKLGLTDKDMGTWVPFPEANLTTWHGSVTDPNLFVGNVTKFARCKRYFPGTPISVMLDSQTFSPRPDSNSANGTTDPNALLSYLDFAPGLIDSFGFQGFTWDSTDDPAVYLNADAVIGAAKRLGVTHVWFNTGTYSVVNNPNGEGIIESSADRRSRVLSGVLAQALYAQNAGLTVGYINIFAQNTFKKGSAGTGTANYAYDTPEALGVLRSFVENAKAHGIPITIFDAPGSSK